MEDMLLGIEAEDKFLVTVDSSFLVIATTASHVAVVGRRLCSV
jgi:hypothetical protein